MKQLSTAAQSPRGDGNREWRVETIVVGAGTIASTAAQSPRGDGNLKHSRGVSVHIVFDELVDSSSIPARGRKPN